MKPAAMNRKHRVLWLSDSPFGRGRFARASREVLTRLAMRQHYELFWLGLGYNGWPYDHVSLPVTIYPSQDAAFAPNALSAILDEVKPDVVVTLGELASIQWICTHPGRPRFLWVAWFPIDSGPIPLGWRTVLNDVDALVATSRFGLSLLEHSLPSKQVRLICPGVATEVFFPLQADQIAKPEFLSNKFVVGHISANDSAMDIATIIKAVGFLARELTDISFCIYVEHEKRTNAAILIERSGLKGKSALVSTAVTGISEEDRNRFYNLCDVIAMPALREGFGEEILESLASGRPVIASDCGACTELVTGHGELVRQLTALTDPNSLVELCILDIEDLISKIRLLYSDRQLLARYTTDGSKFAKTFSWDNVACQWQELIDQVVCLYPKIDD